MCVEFDGVCGLLVCVCDVRTYHPTIYDCGRYMVWSRVNGTLGVPLTASVAGQRYPRGAVDRLHTHTLCSIYRYIVSNTPYSPYIDRTLGLFIDRAYIFRIQASLPGPAPPRYKVQVLSCLNCCLSLVSRPRYWTMTATAQPRKGGQLAREGPTVRGPSNKLMA